MTIRARLTLWYAGVLFASIIVCGTLLYQEWVIEPQERAKRHEGADNETPLEDLFENVLLTAVPAAALGLGGGWWLMRKALAPLAALTGAVERVNENNLEAQLPRSGNGDEFDRLTAVFNGMTARLAESFRRIREFTLHASHELKTPLTIMRGELEVALAEGSMTERQREHLLDELEEIERLASIVDGLTLLTKADAGLVTLKRDVLKLDELLRDIFADGQVLAGPFGVSIVLDPCDRVTVRGDNHRLRQLFLNLVDNAVKYNEPGGTVNLALRNTGKCSEVTITNTGPGIPPEMLSRVFDPFFRGDNAHSRSVDGTGLGLAIARWIVDAHGGVITMNSEPGETSVATVLPLAKEKPDADSA